MPVSNQAILMDAPQLARQALLDELKPFLDKTEIQVFGHDVLIAVYNRAGKKTAGGIIIADSNREDEFQGITGLILEMGPMARGDVDGFPHHNAEFNAWFGIPQGRRAPKVGDWIGFSTQDGKMFKVGSVTCREIEWKYLRFATLTPDAVM